jgi:hypothetical protein
LFNIFTNRGFGAWILHGWVRPCWQGFARAEDGMKEDYVNTVLRKDGIVVTIAPTDGHYELDVEGQHRTVSSEIAADPLGEPGFETIVQELKKESDRLSGAAAATDKPSDRH